MFVSGMYLHMGAWDLAADYNLYTTATIRKGLFQTGFIITKTASPAGRQDPDCKILKVCLGLGLEQEEGAHCP